MGTAILDTDMGTAILDTDMDMAMATVSYNSTFARLCAS